MVEWRWTVTRPDGTMIRAGRWHPDLAAVRRAALRAGVASLDRETGLIAADLFTAYERRDTPVEGNEAPCPVDGKTRG